MADKTLQAVQATSSQRLTADQFEAHYLNQPYELWEGQLVKVSPTVGLHGIILSKVNYELQAFCKSHAIQGELFVGDTGFRLSNITLRAPDVAFVGQVKMATVQDLQKFLPFAPDLAVEVISPSDRAGTVQKKLELYTEAHTPLIWFIYENAPRVVVYEWGKPFRVVRLSGMLDGGEVLPGLQIPVADLFPPQTPPQPTT